MYVVAWGLCDTKWESKKVFVYLSKYNIYRKICSHTPTHKLTKAFSKRNSWTTNFGIMDLLSIQESPWKHYIENATFADCFKKLDETFISVLLFSRVTQLITHAGLSHSWLTTLSMAKVNYIHNLLFQLQFDMSHFIISNSIS